VCRVLLQEGASHVGIISGDVENLCATHERLADPRIVSLHANLARPEQIDSALELFRAKAGKLDLIVNGAGLLSV
jgi:NAD(P)-dependent dehydrogenase (short-subunit alcohol dehydrogenase family)